MGSSSKTSLEEEQRKEHIEERKLLIELQHQASQDFDKTIIALSGGALGLSFTFIRQIVPQANPDTIGLLPISWISLIAALMFILTSLFTSQVGFICATDQLNETYALAPTTNQQTGLIGKVGKKFYNILDWQPLTQICNVAAIMFTIVGLVLLICFGILNISQIQLYLVARYSSIIG